MLTHFCLCKLHPIKFNFHLENSSPRGADEEWNYRSTFCGYVSTSGCIWWRKYWASVSPFLTQSFDAALLNSPWKIKKHISNLQQCPRQLTTFSHHTLSIAASRSPSCSVSEFLVVFNVLSNSAAASAVQKNRQEKIPWRFQLCKEKDLVTAYDAASCPLKGTWIPYFGAAAVTTQSSSKIMSLGLILFSLCFHSIHSDEQFISLLFFSALPILSSYLDTRLYSLEPAEHREKSAAAVDAPEMCNFFCSRIFFFITFSSSLVSSHTEK